MIVGLGVDIILIERVKQMLERRGERALERLYTPLERAYCEKMAHPSLHYAARFAAKEAFVKALGTGFRSGVRWRDVGIVNDPKGKPEFAIEGAAAEQMAGIGATAAFVSLSHDPLQAVAVVVLEKNG